MLSPKIQGAFYNSMVLQLTLNQIHRMRRRKSSQWKLSPSIFKGFHPFLSFQGIFEDFYIRFIIALGIHSGPTLVPFWDPKSDQIGPKRAPMSIQKVIEKLVEFGIDFLTMFNQFWLPTWGAQGVQRIKVSGSSRHPEPPWGPNGTQAPSKLDFWSILIDFWSISGRFWDDFGSILGSMLVDFCLVADG